MPWSPLKFTEVIFQNLRKLGYEYEVSTETLNTEIMRATGLVRPNTRGNVIKAFEQLGYIKGKASGIWEIKYWTFKKQADQPTLTEKEAEIEVVKDELEDYEQAKLQTEQKQELD